MKTVPGSWEMEMFFFGMEVVVLLQGWGLVKYGRFGTSLLEANGIVVLILLMMILLALRMRQIMMVMERMLQALYAVAKYRQ